MAANALIKPKPNIHPSNLHSLRPQPRILRLLLQSRHRLLLERRPEAPAFHAPDLHRILLHPLDSKTPLGSPNRRLPHRRVQPPAVLRGGRGSGLCFSSGGGSAGCGTSGCGGYELFGWSDGRDGDSRCDD
ncbi:hypothetical protein LINPERPRIM_LOCUS39294 [Linum perenne]